MFVKPRRSKSKYGNNPTSLDGLRFASKAEARRYATLRLLERVGDISGLTVQPRFLLQVDGVTICTYVGDFRYQNKDGNLVVEDVKSAPTRTPVYRLKAKLLHALHGIRIVEVE